MKALFLIGLLFVLGQSVDVWTPFLNEEGLEYDVQVDGFEFSKFEKMKGGNGGGKWSDDCEKLGGIKRIQMQCGKYVGSLRLQCTNGKKWLTKRGLGKGNGYGSTKHMMGQGITKVVINAGSYVDKVRFYKGKTQVKRCGRSNGGKAYTAKAPRGMQLCGLKGRAGWWMDKLAAGWCKVSKPKPKKRKCLPCAKEFKKNGGCPLLKKNSPMTASKIPKGCKHCGKVAKKVCTEEKQPPKKRKCLPCAKEFKKKGGCLFLKQNSPMVKHLIPKGCNHCGKVAKEVCEAKPKKRKCGPCAQEFKKAGGCPLLKKNSPLMASKIPKGCDHCGEAAKKACAEKPKKRKCLPCANEFKKAGGCKLWNSKKVNSKIPKGCKHCGATAKKVCFGGSSFYYGTADMFGEDEEIFDTFATDAIEEFPEDEDEMAEEDLVEDEQMFDDEEEAEQMEDFSEEDFAQDEEEESTDYYGLMYTALGVVCVGGAAYMFTRRGKHEYEAITDEE